MVVEAKGFDDHLPEGIFFRNQQRPGESFAMLFLEIQDGVERGDVRRDLAALWSMYDGLRAGVVPELPGDSVPTAGRLTFLLGYGRSLFAKNLLRVAMPEELGRESFTAPVAGKPILRNAGLSWVSDERNIADADFAVQLIGGNELAVRRAVVETCELLGSQESALRVQGWYPGFQRDDGRSWLGFHDGLSNLPSGPERKRVILIRPNEAGNDRWTIGGTYMAYARIAIDVSLWRTLDQSTQETLVGRAKATGCPLIAADPQPKAVGGCPGIGHQVTFSGNEAFHEPPDHVDPAIRASHVQRANQHRPFDRPDSNRIFRQGFEYLEFREGPKPYEAGLNFVSFQNTPQRLLKMLTQNGWLGQTNFGGRDADPAASSLLTVHAAGLFAVPPVRAEDFPAATVWGAVTPQEAR